MKVLVTGGAGFIGANLTRRLCDSPEVDEVIVVDDLSLGRLSNLDGVPARFVEGSILDTELLTDLTNDVTSVVHLAAIGSVPRSIQDPVASHDANATGTLNVLEAARSASAHVIVASSSSVYGATQASPKSETLPTRPMSPYAASKLAAEAYALAYGHSMGLPTLAFRFFNVFGPLQPADHDYAAVIPRFVAALMAGDAVTIHGDGEQTRDFTYVATVCEALTAAVVRRVAHPDPVNLAFGQPLSLLDVVELLRARFGEVAIDYTDPRPGDVRHSNADSSVLRSLFPELEPTPFEQGLDETIAWFERES